MKVQRFRKSIITILCLTTVLYHIFTLSTQYLKYETKVKIELVEKQTMELPAFTTCFEMTEMFHFDKILRIKPEWKRNFSTYQYDMCSVKQNICYKQSNKLRKMMRYKSGKDMRRNWTIKQIHRMSAMISELFA